MSLMPLGEFVDIIAIGCNLWTGFVLSGTATGGRGRGAGPGGGTIFSRVMGLVGEDEGGRFEILKFIKGVFCCFKFGLVGFQGFCFLKLGLEFNLEFALILDLLG